MKIHELIHKLQDYPEDMEVKVIGIKVWDCYSWGSYLTGNIKFTLELDTLEIKGDLDE